MKSLFSFMKKISIKVFNVINFIRLFILNSLFILIILILMVSTTHDDESVEVAKNSYLTLNLNGFLVEQKQQTNLSKELQNQLSGSDQSSIKEFEVQEVIKVIEHAKQDPNIIGLILKLDGLRSGSLDQLADIGKAIEGFKKSKKEVHAYASNYSQTQYYLAAYADNVTLAPNGAVLLQGYAVNRLYFKDLLDKLLITPHIFKVGTYKSFVEPFTETKMSSYSKDANSHWLNQLWDHYINHVLAQRSDNKRLTAASVNPTLKQLKIAVQAVSGDSAQYAMSVGLVDKLAYYDTFIANLHKTVNDDKITTIDYQAYTANVPQLYSTTQQTNQVAVIHGSGEIVSGTADNQSIADNSFNKLLKQALNDPKVKAVVIRLNTPGGSAFASENIRQQVLALKAAGKKVVVSMGSVTASGGYWIAASADKIVAAPTTLTGSIGIFGMFATIDKTLNKIGIHQDGVSTNALANLGVTQPLNPKLAEIFQIGIEGGYANFLKVVAEGRAMSLKAVDKVAQGRVWTGKDALNNGLVDKLGNLQSAIDIASELASLDEYEVIEIKPTISPREAMINDFLSQSITLLPSNILSQTSLSPIFTALSKQANFTTRINDPQNRFVFCTICNIN